MGEMRVILYSCASTPADDTTMRSMVTIDLLMTLPEQVYDTSGWRSLIFCDLRDRTIAPLVRQHVTTGQRLRCPTAPSQSASHSGQVLSAPNFPRTTAMR